MNGQPVLATADHEALIRAIRLLERPSFTIKIAAIAGQPISGIIGMLPRVVIRNLTKPLEVAIVKCLEIAIQSLDELQPNLPPELPPSRWLPRIMTGFSGGIAGFFGVAALPIELPLTTMLMLRAIAEIARHEGEDLKDVKTAMACLEVFAFADSRTARRGDVSYYATRAVTAKLTAEVVAVAVQQGSVDVASPAVMRMVAEIASHFGLAVTDRAAAGAIPVIGALGGAAVNILFMEHFRQIAEAHFQVRRLERQYGDATIRALYRSVAVEDRRLRR
jgi:hypothetical protein